MGTADARAGGLDVGGRRRDDDGRGRERRKPSPTSRFPDALSGVQEILTVLWWKAVWHGLGGLGLLRFGGHPRSGLVPGEGCP